MNSPTTDLRYDPYDYGLHEDPYPTYARMRTEAPVFRNDDLGFWALSRHSDVLEAFRDSDRFISSHGVSLDPAASGPHAHRTMSFLAMDPPMHGRMRGLVSRGFTPRRVLELEPRIRELTRRYLDDALQSGSFDFIGDLAGRLPMDVISELLGVPESDRDEVRQKADLLVHRGEGETDVPAAGVEAAFSLIGYYSDMLAERRAHRTDDLTSALLDAQIDDDRLDDSEIIGFLFLMVVAGNETTTKLLGNAWFWAWASHGQQEVALASSDGVPAWIEETLRYDTSTQMLARTLAADTTLHGVTMSAGDRAVLLVGSANRDPEVFEDPDAYRIGRKDVSNLISFGFGRHFCLGASLARLQARVALEELQAAVRSYEIDDDAARRVHSINVRGFASLPTTVRAR